VTSIPAKSVGLFRPRPDQARDGCRSQRVRLRASGTGHAAGSARSARRRKAPSGQSRRHARHHRRDCVVGESLPQRAHSAYWAHWAHTRKSNIGEDLQLIRYVAGWAMRDSKSGIRFTVSRVRIHPAPPVAFSRSTAGMRERLKAEAGGAILAWIVGGARLWLAEGTAPPQVVRELTADYMSEQDLIGHLRRMPPLRASAQRLSIAAHEPVGSSPRR